MKRAIAAGASALVVGGGIVGYLLYRKKRELEALVENAEKAARHNAAAKSELAYEAGLMTRRLETYAKSEAERVAEAAASAHLAGAYGLTPERIAAIGRLASRFS